MTVAVDTPIYTFSQESPYLLALHVLYLAESNLTHGQKFLSVFNTSIITTDNDRTTTLTSTSTVIFTSTSTASPSTTIYTSTTIRSTNIALFHLHEHLPHHFRLHLCLYHHRNRYSAIASAASVTIAIIIITITVTSSSPVSFTTATATTHTRAQTRMCADAGTRTRTPAGSSRWRGCPPPACSGAFPFPAQTRADLRTSPCRFCCTSFALRISFTPCLYGALQ
ncbi:hypothetical protein H920_18104 [Fukomys damarensis]|uniref:Uncharacterized protein n=1 Tax=Fukomys damarensis TaxID=885580 RepID=A0A091DCG0_FUKDA|nr:hypothetical protein H920_18104 [Fukomys damarensis]